MILKEFLPTIFLQSEHLHGMFHAFFSVCYCSKFAIGLVRSVLAAVPIAPNFGKIFYLARKRNVEIAELRELFFLFF